MTLHALSLIMIIQIARPMSTSSSCVSNRRYISRVASDSHVISVTLSQSAIYQGSIRASAPLIKNPASWNLI